MGVLRGRVFYAGGAFLAPTSRRGVPGEYLGEDVVAAADRLVSISTESSDGARRRR
jgi:hypothetical protein